MLYLHPSRLRQVVNVLLSITTFQQMFQLCQRYTLAQRITYSLIGTASLALQILVPTGLTASV